jgi:hypothetical protein
MPAQVVNHRHQSRVQVGTPVPYQAQPGTVAVARAEGDDGVNTDNANPGNPSSPDEPGDGEQPQGLLPGQPETHELELDAYGVPVQGRAAKGRTTVVITGCLICAIVPAVLALVEGIYHDIPPTLVWLGVIMGFLPGGAAAFTERWHKKIQKKIEKKIQLGQVGRRIIIGAMIVGMISAFALIGIYDPNALSG